MSDPGRSVELVPTPGALAEAAARRFIAAATSATGERGLFRVALSGGTTPAPLYRLLATPSLASRIRWPQVEFHWSDERCVPPDDPASNFRMAREALLDAVAVDPARVHRMPGESDPAVGAATYEGLLRAEFATPTGPPTTRSGARFDLVLLGLGNDGHVASLLPGLLPPPTTDRWVVPVAASPWPRLTFTPALINAAREILVLVSGAAKAEIVRRTFAPPGPGGILPAQLIHPGAGTLHWILDQGAASRLAP